MTPTTEGYYWFRQEGEVDWEVLKVVWIEDEKELMIHAPLHPAEYLYIDTFDGEWEKINKPQCA